MTAVPLLVASRPNWWLAIPALLSYTTSFGLAVQALRPRNYHDVPDPAPFAAEAWNEPPRGVLGALIETRVHAFDANAKTNKHKPHRWDLASWALVLAATLSTTALAVDRLQNYGQGQATACTDSTAGAKA